MWEENQTREFHKFIDNYIGKHIVQVTAMIGEKKFLNSLQMVFH